MDLNFSEVQPPLCRFNAPLPKRALSDVGMGSRMRRSVQRLSSSEPTQEVKVIKVGPTADSAMEVTIHCGADVWVVGDGASSPHFTHIAYDDFRGVATK
jgi:hypothetical protein